MKSIVEIKNDLTSLSKFFEYEELENTLRVKLNVNTKEELTNALNTLYVYEAKLDLQNLPNIWLDLKGLDNELLIEAFLYSINYSELIDPTMILNILNLIKIYNTLSDDFFNHERVYFKSLTDFLDIKITIKKDLKEFTKKIGIRFYSLVKSCNKIQDNSTAQNLENIYNMIFSSIDFMTLCGILSNTNDFSTDECYVIKNAHTILYNLIEKSYVNNQLLDTFLKGLNTNANKSN